MRGVHGLWTVLLVFALGLAGCGGDDDSSVPLGGAGASSKAPTKEAVVVLLRSVLTALEAKDYDTVVTHLVAFPGMSAEALRKDVAGWIERREVSGPGIDILAEKGRFGPLQEVFEGRGNAWAKKAGVPVEKCHALAHETAEVAVYWGGSTLQLIRLNNVGKL